MLPFSLYRYDHTLLSVHHHPRVVPVEFLSGDGEGSPHALHGVAHSLMHPLDVLLILCFSSVDRCDDAISVSVFQRDVLEVFVKAEVDVAMLKVVIVDLDGTIECIVLRVDFP